MANAAVESPIEIAALLSSGRPLVSLAGNMCNGPALSMRARTRLIPRTEAALDYDANRRRRSITLYRRWGERHRPSARSLSTNIDVRRYESGRFIAP